MPSDLNAMMNSVAMIATFTLVMSLWIGAVLFWSARHRAKADRVERRLHIDANREDRTRVLSLWRHGELASTVVPVATEAMPVLHRFDRHLRRAGWENGVGAMVALVGGSILLASAFVALVTSNVFLGAAVGLAIVIVLRIILAGRIARREAIFESQLVDAMELAARSLRAGHPLLGAFQLISEEMAPPVSTVFGDLCQRQEMGATIGDSLKEAAQNATSADMKMFATSVAIQMRTGGNLADLMDRLGKVIRERIRLNRRVRILTSQTQTSKRVLIALPFITFVILNLLNPAYMSPLYTTTTGRILLGIAAAGLAMGAWAINRMAVLRY